MYSTTSSALSYYIRDSSSDMLGDDIRGVSKTMTFVASANTTTVIQFLWSISFLIPRKCAKQFNSYFTTQNMTAVMTRRYTASHF